MRDIRDDKRYFFSQASLTIFKKCPLKFKMKYMEGLSWSNDTSIKRFYELGQGFHLTVERFYSKIDTAVEELDENKYGEIKIWFARLENKIGYDESSKYFPEYEIRMDKDEIRLQGKYDLIEVKEDGKVIIWDWKTEPVQLKKENMDAKYQTLVYMYLVYENIEFITDKKVEYEDITMTYWQPEFEDSFIEIHYSKERHEEVKKRLYKDIERIKAYNFEEEFKKERHSKSCHLCEFNSLCNNDSSSEKIVFENEDILLDELDWDELEEIDI